MNTSSFAAFEADARTAGFDQVMERPWAADTALDTHTHPFDVEAYVAEGELWLTHDGGTRHLRAGDTFSLAREVPHSERYGPRGAKVWVARRHAR
jgi:quercetin dioxygenase-like cupin family protein